MRAPAAETADELADLDVEDEMTRRVLELLGEAGELGV